MRILQGYWQVNKQAAAYYIRTTMRALLLPALLCFATTGYGQALPIDSLTHKVSYQAVVAAPGNSADVLYSRAKAWAASTLGARMEVALDDPTGRVFIARVPSVVKTRAAVGSFDQTLWHLVHLEARDGRYQYILTDFVVQPYVYSAANQSRPSKSQLREAPVEESLKKGAPKVYSQSILEGTNTIAAAEITSLRKALSATSSW